VVKVLFIPELGPKVIRQEKSQFHPVQMQKDFSQFPPSKTCHTTGKGKAGYFSYMFIKLDMLS